jgi:hypothetical protein
MIQLPRAPSDNAVKAISLVFRPGYKRTSSYGDIFGYLLGRLAKESIKCKLAKALVRLAPAELEMTEIPFKDLLLYS